jgi:hypothetical protein
MTRAELTAWIEELRRHLERGELADAEPVHLFPWLPIPNVEAFARRSLAEVDD